MDTKHQFMLLQRLSLTSRERQTLRGLAMQKRFTEEPLLLCIKRSHEKVLEHLTRMPPGCLLGEMFQACLGGVPGA